MSNTSTSTDLLSSGCIIAEPGDACINSTGKIFGWDCLICPTTLCILSKCFIHPITQGKNIKVDIWQPVLAMEGFAINEEKDFNPV